MAGAGAVRLGRIAALAVLVAGAARPAAAQGGDTVLSPEQSRIFRAWMVRIVDAQIAQGASPRWSHRDCAGLVRFAVAESLRAHDEAWRRAAGLSAPLPPELSLPPEEQALRHQWRLADGRRSAFVGALEMIQENAAFVSKDVNLAQAGDLFFFDQGDDQHLMIWTGRYVAYHTGQEPEPASDARFIRAKRAGGLEGVDVTLPSSPNDGLRAVSIPQLLSWRDTRWQPVPDNPNFLGVFRLRFLSR
jgi:uncharacterized protein